MTKHDENPLEQLLKVTKAVSVGDFSQEVVVDAEGIIAQLAGELNHVVRNLRSAIPTFSQTTDKAGLFANTAQSIGELMTDSTKVVLDNSDDLISTCEQMEARGVDDNSNKDIKHIKALTLDIISSQSYQDNARQKLERLEQDLCKIRDSLLEAMIAMNIKTTRDANAPDKEAKLEEQKKLLESAQKKNEEQKQDLVDQLLAEFGL